MSQQTAIKSVVVESKNGNVNGEILEKSNDPLVKIVAAFYSVPDEYHMELFNDFREAAESHDLRRLLDTISDWAATAELYAHPSLAAEVQEAIGGRKGVADWLIG